MTKDSSLPSLLHPSSGNRAPPLSATTTGASTPLNPAAGAGSILPSNPTLAHNQAIARLVTQLPPSTTRTQSPVHSTGATTPVSATGTNPARTQRESSIDPAKRRRLNVPVQSSNLRQSSLGPSTTPKPGTPGGTTRAGSAGPRSTTTVKKPPTKSNLAPPTHKGHLAPGPKSRGGAGSRRKHGGGRKGIKASLSDTGDDSALSEVDNSENDAAGAQRAAGEDVEMGGVDEEDEDGGDDRKYCTCRSVSYGNMVACDNDHCEYEWFHWSCVGITKEPQGKWFCDDCKRKLGVK